MCSLLPPVTRGLVVHHFARGLARLGRGGLAFAFGDFARLNFRNTPCLFLRRALPVLFVAAAPALFLQTLLVQAFLLEPLMLRAFDRGLGLLLGFTQLVDLLLLMPRLVLEHFALDVGALAAHFDVDGARTPLRARQLQLRLRFAAQGDLARRRIHLRVVVTVAAPQMRQQLVLRILADHILCAVDLDPGLIELLQQPVHRDFQHLGELSDGNICHTCS